MNLERPQQLTEEEKKREKVKNLESLNIGPAQKAAIILVALRLKPAAELDLFKGNDKPELVVKILEDAGLLTARKDLPPKAKTVLRLAIACDEEILEKLEKTDPAKDHEEFGNLMGYPKTAVDAFLNKEKRLPRDAYPADREVIFQIILSKDHWQEELEILRKWSGAIKEYAPDLYAQLKGK